MAAEQQQEALGSNVASIILAGGRGSRFGSPKAAAPFLGRPLLDWVVDAALAVSGEVVVVAAPEDTPGLPSVPAPVRLVRDSEAFLGPLAGATTGLAAVQADTAFLLSCDAPLLQPRFLSALLPHLDGHDAVLPVTAGRRQPLTALYRVRPVLSAFQADLDAGERSIIRALEGLDVITVDEAALRQFDPHLVSFRGINTVDDLTSLEADARSMGLVSVR